MGRAFASGAQRCIAAPGMQRNRKKGPPDASRSLVLVGMMGVGKSTVGRRLALRLGLPFVDADDAIVEAAGMSIQDMFDRFGEPHFRDGERRVITRLIEEGPKVIATGGGAFVHPDTRALILDKAIAIWLDADIDILVERVSRREGRPLLKDRDPRTVLTELAQQRNPIYALAQVHVTSTATPHDATVDRIVEALQACA